VIAEELELALHNAFVNARQHRHQFIGVEHLLLAILETPSAVRLLQASGARLDDLRKTLTDHLAAQTPQFATDEEVDTQPTIAFQRTIQRAILRVQSSGKTQVLGSDVLSAILLEKKSHAAQLLKHQGIEQNASSVVQPTDQAADASPDVQVVLHNDDFTPMEFVVQVLERFFGMNREEATEAMLEVHRSGSAVCGLYSRQDGEVVAAQVTSYALEHGWPLRCVTATPK
jgi:ATP-dependent Clp protease adapter protein ClpS